MAHEGQFKLGHAGGPGRPKGARSRLGEAFISALLADFEAHGIGAIRRACEEKPADYLRVIASLMPKELTGEDGGAIVTRIERVIIDPQNRDC